MKNTRLTLVCLAALSLSSLVAKELGALSAVYGDVRRQARERVDCMAWYDFSGLETSGLMYASSGDELEVPAGRWPEQKAAHLFHGSLRGKLVDIPATGFTLCCWLRVNGFDQTSDNPHGCVMSMGDGWRDGWRMILKPREGRKAILVFTIGRPGDGVGVNCGGRFAMGEWHHVAVTWDHETLAVWIDGIVRTQALVAMPYTPPTKRPQFGIGACGTDGLGALDMEIADLAFFSTALPVDVLKRLHNPDAEYERAVAMALAKELPVPTTNATHEQEQAYRDKLKPFLARPGASNRTLICAVRAIAGLRIADSFRRAGQFEEAKRAYATVADRADAPLHCRARAMLAAGDMHRDAKRYEAARREYEKTRDFFTGKREAFRVDALERLRDIETLADGAPFKDQRARRIERISHATQWFFVAPAGDDAAPGTAQRPFRTLERARDAVRERRKIQALPAGGVAIMLRAGVYPRELQSFALSAEDSGTAESPIIYQAAAGGRVVIRGGRTIGDFKPLSDPVATKRIPEPARKHVMQTDLKARGVAHFGELRVRGPRGSMKEPECPAHLELFFNGRPMSLARWPNHSLKLSERFAAVEPGDQKIERNLLENPEFFSYSNPRQDAWADEPDGWVFGYWKWMWFGTYQKMARVDSAARAIHIDWNLAAGKKPWHYGIVKGAPYLGVNLLCELDSPGEWYLDRSSGLLFFWPPSAPLAGEPPPSRPPSPVDKGEAVVSVLEKPLVTLTDVSHVVFRGLTLEAGRHHGVIVNGGNDVLLAGCVVRNIGVDGVVINGGRGHEVVGCDVAYTGDGGVKMYGGDIDNLTPSGHVLENCHIHHVARWNPSETGPGILVGQHSSAEQAGVGCRISRCLIHDAPMYGIRVHGNDNIVEYSEIHDVCHEAGDAGAFNMYGSVGKRALLERGNVLRYNYWHHLPQDDTFKGVHHIGRMGIYIDSMNGSITVYGNVFQKCDYSYGTIYFGTCDSHIENNLFHRCFRGVRFSDRSYLYNKCNRAPSFVLDAYLAKAAANPVWARRYPRLTTYPPRATDMSVFLMGNVVARNIAVDCGPLVSGADRVIDLARIESNWTEGAPGFKDLDGGDFTLDPKSPALVAAAFEPLPFKQMGLYDDELRATWPIEHKIGVYKTALKEAHSKRKARTEMPVKMPVCQARPCTAKIVVDGRLDAAEWGDLDKAHAIKLERNPHGRPSKAIPSYVWVRRNETDLFIAVLNELNPDEKPAPRKDEKASWFLDADIVELMFEGDAGIASTWRPGVRRHGPVFYLAGDCAGSFDSIAVGDMPKPRAAGLRVAVTYAAASEPGCWTAEWRIPLKALCLDPKQTPSCCFNVAVHKPGTRPAKQGEKVTYLEHWVKWAGDPVSQAWAVWNAGYLQLWTQQSKSTQERVESMKAKTTASGSAAVEAVASKWLGNLTWPAWAVAGKAGSQVEPVDEEEAKRWLRWAIPLPKRVQLTGKLALPASDVGLRLRSDATGVEQSARDELAKLIAEKAGVEQLDGPFPILIGVCDAEGKIDGVSVPGADKLRGLKNDDQAYVISPLPTRGLAVAGLTERGVYHGVKTLQQLLEPGLTKGKVTMPIVAVLDWPDLAERGEWRFGDLDVQRVVQYLADRKLNLLEVYAALAFDDNGRGLLKTDIEGRKNAWLHAVKWVPFITHLNLLGSRFGIYKHCPQIKGQGPHAHLPSRDDLVVPCASHPRFTRVLAEWLMSAGAEKVTDVTIFLTELKGMQCECDQCKDKPQPVLEAKACVKAWQIAREKYPQLRLRILLSQASYHVNDQALAAVPQPEVGIIYYSGSTTYTASRDPMIYPLMADFAKKGRWLGCMPQLKAAYSVACPWSGPQFIKYRMTELVDKGLSCLCGHVLPDNRLFDFNVTAAAEWSWNAHGRSEREFAAAWATRRGMADPEKAADWAVMLGPVGWDVYGSKVPLSHFFGRAATMVEKRQPPTLGQGMFRYFPTIEHMNDDLAVCEKALKLVEQLNEPALIAETHTIQDYVRMIKSIYTIANAVAGKKKLDDAETKSLQAAFGELQAAGRQTTNALSVWANAVVPGGYELGNRDATGVTGQTVTDIGDALVPFGIKNR